jgi:XTP/dITP diphosphohydrolase
MPEVLLIGSGNRDKAAELAQLLRGLPWEVKCLKDFEAVEEPEEDGETFEANALLKAEFYGSHFGVACVADDSGLEVDALNGAPGVYSARYAGEHCSYGDNNTKLLDALTDTPQSQRGARFVCCAVFRALDNATHVVRGTCEGNIATNTRGHNGFGYDPVFIPQGHDKTFGELDASNKHDLSHRGEAFTQMRAFLEAQA